MADQRDGGITWTDETWNPVVGCSILSPACTNCYAMGMAARIENIDAKQRIRAYGNARHLDELHPEGEDPVRAKLLRPLTHYAGTTKVVNGKPVWTGKLAMAPNHIVMKPLHWKRPRRVFVNSMSDLFHPDMPEEWIDEVFAVMALAPQHTFQILTKRPERMRRYFAGIDNGGEWIDGEGLRDAIIEGTAQRIYSEAHKGEDPSLWLAVHMPLPNVWLGVTAEDQARADERIPHLLATPAAVRFVSAEPLLGPIDFQSTAGGTLWIGGQRGCGGTHRHGGRTGETIHGVVHHDDPTRSHHHHDERCGHGLDWIIVGGESGDRARHSDLDWYRSIRDQCAVAGVAFHMKQITEKGRPIPMDRWPEDLRIQQSPV